MISHNKDQRFKDFSGDQPDCKSYDDYDILEPSPDFDLYFLEGEDDELSDYTLMGNANTPDYEE
jgi:hypothetical protein